MSIQMRLKPCQLYLYIYIYIYFFVSFEKNTGANYLICQQQIRRKCNDMADHDVVDGWGTLQTKVRKICKLLWCVSEVLKSPRRGMLLHFAT